MTVNHIEGTIALTMKDSDYDAFVLMKIKELLLLMMMMTVYVDVVCDDLSNVIFIRLLQFKEKVIAKGKVTRKVGSSI